MTHYNESWDLPPLVGSCYMYGPQQTAEVTADDVWRLLELRARRDNLQKALGILSGMELLFLQNSDAVQQQQATRLDPCCTLLRQALKVMDDEIYEARGTDKFSALLSEWGEE